MMDDEDEGEGERSGGASPGAAGVRGPGGASDEDAPELTGSEEDSGVIGEGDDEEDDEGGDGGGAAAGEGGKGIAGVAQRSGSRSLCWPGTRCGRGG